MRIMLAPQEGSGQKAESRRENERKRMFSLLPSAFCFLPSFAPLLEVRFRQREIFRTRDLDVEWIAGNDVDLVAVMRGQTGFVSGIEFFALGAGERIAKNVVSKALRRLCSDEIRSIDGRGKPAIACRVNGVGDRKCGKGSAMLLRGIDQRSEGVDS